MQHFSLSIIYPFNPFWLVWFLNFSRFFLRTVFDLYDAILVKVRSFFVKIDKKVFFELGFEVDHRFPKKLHLRFHETIGYAHGRVNLRLFHPEQFRRVFLNIVWYLGIVRDNGASSMRVQVPKMLLLMINDQVSVSWSSSHYWHKILILHEFGDAF